MSNEQQQTRRTVLYGAAAIGAGVTVSACGGGGGTPGEGAATPTAPVDLGAASAVPVGGAKLFREQRLLVSQPEKGGYKAFSAVCTHKGCVLSEIKGDEGDCMCHGSRFDTRTGKVLQGPAARPLPEVPVREENGKLIAGPEKKQRS